MQIRDFLAPTDAVIDVRASEKAGLLQDLANRIAPSLNSPSALVAPALLKREALGSTGTGNGVAIPHARLLNIKRPFGFFVRLDKAIDFDAIDGRPVDLVFALLLPDLTNGEQLNALACVARKLRETKTLARLRSAENDTQFYLAIAE
jgi:PTS system nitrogen regulatory IIA component